MPDADTFGRSRRRLAPHVYTDGEVTDLLAAAGRLSPKGTLRPVTYRALFGLIAATGLRVSEALRLQCADVDLDAGMLTVRQTKFAKSRLVPLHPTTVRALKQYLALRQRHLPTVQGGPFLASARGTALAKRTLVDLDFELVLAFLDHLERDRKNGARSRNARLAALRSFLKYPAHYDLSALGVIEQALAVPMKRFDRPMLGFLARQEMQAILDAPDTATWAGQRDHALFTMLYNTGARVSEIIDLRIKSLILDTAPAVHLTGKGRKQRTVPLWHSTVTVMRAWKRRMGRPWTARPCSPIAAAGPCRARTSRNGWRWRLLRLPSSILSYWPARSRRIPSGTPRPCTCCSRASTWP